MKWTVKESRTQERGRHYPLMAVKENSPVKVEQRWSKELSFWVTK
jgi:hypothetical protein